MLNVDVLANSLEFATISKLSTIPFDKGTSTNALDVLPRFEDSRESIVEKKDEI
jgi:hypothetical protein